MSHHLHQLVGCNRRGASDSRQSPAATPRRVRCYRWTYWSIGSLLTMLYLVTLVGRNSMAGEATGLATEGYPRAQPKADRPVPLATDRSPGLPPAASSESSPEAANSATDMPRHGIATDPDAWLSPQGLGSTIKVVLGLTVISMAPAILLMTTSFVRIVVVLGLLKQALGAQQIPNQIVTSVALFMTLLIMTPVWKDVYHNAVEPYTAADGEMSLEEAWAAGSEPVKQFMSRQIDIARNSDDIWLFFQYLPPAEQAEVPSNYDEVPIRVLLPAFVLSELKVAFLIGFQIYLPFLILDIVVSSVTTSMGMLMLPPVMISLPFKLMLFVLLDGWNLVVGMLMESFAPYG